VALALGPSVSADPTSYEDTVLADSPTGYWRLGESSGTDAADSSGNGNTGTYQNGPTLGATGLLSEDSDTAVTLDGTDDRVDVPADAVSLPTAGSAFSVEAWFKTTATSGMIFAARKQGTSLYGKILVQVSSGKLYASVTGSASGSSPFQLGGTETVNDGVAHHVVFTRDSSGVLHLFLDGGEIEQKSDGNAAITDLTLQAFGFDRQLGSGYFNGTIDEAALYNTALSPDRVRVHHQFGSVPGAWQTPEQTFGTLNGSGTHGKTPSKAVSDPVNTLTGAFTHQVLDLDLPATGVSFALVRSYTSADSSVGRFGRGWWDSYAVSLTEETNGDALLKGEEGQEIRYTLLADGSFQGSPGSLSTLAAVSGGYKLTRADQTVYNFDQQGRLTSVEDRNQQGVTLAYDGSGRLSTVTDSADRAATFSYDGASVQPSSVSLPDGRDVSFGYTNGLLTSVTDVRGKVWTYTYDGGDRLATIVDPLSHTQVTNVYNATTGRITEQTDATDKTTTFAWDEETETATVTDPNGNVWEDVYRKNVLQEETDPLAQTTSYSYDSDLNVSQVTGPAGAATTMTYDAAGNLLTATAPASLGSAEKTFVYNANNDPTSVTDARDKVTSYTYTTAGNLATVTQDGVQVAEYTYDSAGRPLGSVRDITSQSGSSQRTYCPAHLRLRAVRRYPQLERQLADQLPQVHGRTRTRPASTTYAPASTTQPQADSLAPTPPTKQSAEQPSPPTPTPATGRH
jgi:YD repeat-containing protein